MLKMLLSMIFIFFWALPTVAGQVSGIDALFDNENREQIQVLLENRNSSPTSLVSVSRLLSHAQIAKLYEKKNISRSGLMVGD